MANRSYMAAPHRLIPGYSPLGGSRDPVGSAPRNSPPDFSYEALQRSTANGSLASGAGARDGGGAGAGGGSTYGGRPPTSPVATSALSLGYPGVAEFPYGLSGVQMPTYNFGSELYNYVSNGFPRKSRMCTFCNKVFTRSTTRRYHERRCPLLRASNSLAKSEENSAAAAAAAAAMKEQQQQPPRHPKDNGVLSRSLPSPSAGGRSGLNGVVHPPGRENRETSRERVRDMDRENSGHHMMNGGLHLSGRHSPPQLRHTPATPERRHSSTSGTSSPPPHPPAPPPGLHPAYPTSAFPPGGPASVLASGPSRAAAAAAAAYSYAQTYGSHFYNSISAAALASLERNGHKDASGLSSGGGAGGGKKDIGPFSVEGSGLLSPWGSASASALSPSPSKPWDHHHIMNHSSHSQHHQQQRQQQQPPPPPPPIGPLLPSSSSLPSTRGSRSDESGRDAVADGKSSLTNSIMSSLGMDLTSRYCADFRYRSGPVVFPGNPARDGNPDVSSTSPEPGETRPRHYSQGRARSNSPGRDLPEEDQELRAADLSASGANRENGWSSPSGSVGGERDRKSDAGEERGKEREERLPYHSYDHCLPDKIQTANLSGSRLKSTSPSVITWGGKSTALDASVDGRRSSKDQPPTAPFMAVRPLDDDEEEEEEEDEEDEEEMEEDEEQFNEAGSAGSRDESLGLKRRSLDMMGNNATTHVRGSVYNPLVCSICKKSFPDPLARQTHEALHSQAKAFACALCDRAFHCAYSLRIHFLRQHSSGGPYPCKHCSEKYDGALALKAHLVTQHALSKAEACSLKYFSLLEEPTGSPRSSSSCSGSGIGNGFVSSIAQRSALSDSERDNDKGRDDFSSHTSRTSPTHRRSADSFLNGHDKDYRHISEGDGRRSERHHNSLYDLAALKNNKNMLDITPALHLTNGDLSPKAKSLLSPVSPQNLFRGMDRSNHNNNLGGVPDPERGSKPGDHKSGDEPTEVCKVCNKSFAKSFIRFHERAHADQKPYECSICHKRFGYKNNMKSHMKLHAGLKPYQCQICGARFTRGSTLRRHGRRHNISRNSMLEFVLYDHSAGPSRAAGVSNAKPAVSSASASATGGGSIYAQHLDANVGAPTRSRDGRSASGDILPGIGKQHGGMGLHVNNPDRYGGPHNGRRPSSPHSPRIPQSSVTPGASSTSHAHLSGQQPGMTTPMVGGLAAVAAANLFGYQAAAAPHLYQLYAASAAPLMSYPHGYGATSGGSHASPYSGTHPAQAASAVQSDALNLSLGKRKSPFSDDDDASSEKTPRRGSDSSGSSGRGGGSGGANYRDGATEKRPNSPPHHQSRTEPIKIETDEPRDLDTAPRETIHNPFTPMYSPKMEKSPPVVVPPVYKTDPDYNSQHGQHHNDSPHKAEDAHYHTNHRLDHHPRRQHHHHHHHHHHHSRDENGIYQEKKESIGEGEGKLHPDVKEELKITTEDFAAQVNFCCPSPLVQSSTGTHPHLHRSNSANGSPPVGSSTFSSSSALSLHKDNNANSTASTATTSSTDSNSTTTTSAAAGSTTVDSNNGTVRAARASPSGHVMSQPNSPDGNLTGTGTASPIPSPTADGDSALITIDGEVLDNEDAVDDDGCLDDQKKLRKKSNGGLGKTLNELLLSLISAGRMFHCGFCEIYFAEYAMFRLHQKYHQCDLERPFVCSVCGEDCKDKTYFTVHLAEHLGLGTKQPIP